MADVIERNQTHRVDLVPHVVEGSPDPLYSVWVQGRQLVPPTAQPIVRAIDKMQRLGYNGLIEVWSPDKPWLLRVERL
jgi:hypothetical protein